MHLQDFLRGQLKHFILRSLQKEKLHGYAIVKKIEEFTFGAWKPTFGSIYPALSKMEKQKLVSSKCEKNGRKKKTYCITALGRKVLKQETKKAKKIQKKASELYEKIFSIQQNPIELIEAYLSFFSNIKNKQIIKKRRHFVNFLLKQKQGKISTKKTKQFEQALLEFLKKVEKINS